MDLRALDDPPPPEVTQLTDINTISCWEQWLKLSYGTSDLHIIRAWSLTSHATELAFDSQARALRGPLVYSFLDGDRLPAGVGREELLGGRHFSFDWAQLVYPVGALGAPPAFAACPAGTFRCFVALCPHCILIGHHSAADFSEHPLISTLDAYKMSMQGTSPSEDAINIRREKIIKELQQNHQLLSRLHANFASVHRRIDDSNKRRICLGGQQG
ncbi:B-box zinc finger protein, putative [Eimeria mitis]|uniref:B-box zinc finger protein, putative n=1 Tax=Eimeria mitis TaxID=44415 RepID=U6K1X7_9EIME|nr:B-box zinc finger protein, putative [Eimeria mitis]CDJ29778.1 B-box zinc finger protein, putative [Eimeria mitis]